MCRGACFDEKTLRCPDQAGPVHDAFGKCENFSDLKMQIQQRIDLDLPRGNGQVHEAFVKSARLAAGRWPGHIRAACAAFI